jgi:hypothetical protein
MSGIAPKRNAFIFKIAPQANIHRKNDFFFLQEDGPPGQRGPVLKHT